MAEVKLSIEKQFSLRSFESQVDQMNLEQARHISKVLYERMLVLQQTYNDLLAAKWGINDKIIS